jgi:hypothetical protein
MLPRDSKRRPDCGLGSLRGAIDARSNRFSCLRRATLIRRLPTSRRRACQSVSGDIIPERAGDIHRHQGLLSASGATPVMAQ